MIDEVDADGCRGCVKRRWLVGFTRGEAVAVSVVCFLGGRNAVFFFCWENFLGGGFKYLFIFIPIWGRFSNLINIFQMG